MIQRILKAETYDRLKALADSRGGVGMDKWFAVSEDNIRDESCPVCINGMGVTLGLAEVIDGYLPLYIPAIGVTTTDNDRTVHALIAEGHGSMDSYGDVRVPFDSYALRLNIVRGDS